MSEETSPPRSEAAADAERERVAAALGGLRAAVRQRQAELASARGGDPMRTLSFLDEFERHVLHAHDDEDGGN